ncbi:MAG TPA: hypothetical protein VNQ80_12415 [Parapedobacter sp.]|uniref:hypothetical protein n=1 Tax=Parapedobacter sp. TaxID=1958893 RepID=UPI002C407648|nr:hypothetical protein [Parapedobacter sp.]HWK58141.1 hypothetical protein [Parapedobacter sp.]
MKPLILIFIAASLISCSKKSAPQPEPQQLTYHITAGHASEVVIYLHRTNMVVRDTIYGQVLYYDKARPGDILRFQLKSLAGTNVSVNIEYSGSYLLHQSADEYGFIKIEGRLPQ